MVKGINFKENNSGTIEVGIHTDFIEYLKSLSPNAAGYFNFNLVKNYKPSSKGGYTHRLELQGKQQVNGQVIKEGE
jgi:hypothetical protein